MNKRTLIITGILAAITLVAVPFLYAQHQQGGMHRMHGGAFGDFGLGHLARAKDYLGLTDAQVDQLKAIGKEMHEQNAAYRKQMHSGYMEVAQTLINDPNNLTAAQALIDKQDATERALKTNVLTAASKALNVLTPDQRAKVADFLSKRAAMHNAQ